MNGLRRLLGIFQELTKTLAMGKGSSLPTYHGSIAQLGNRALVCPHVDGAAHDRATAAKRTSDTFSPHLCGGRVLLVQALLHLLVEQDALGSDESATTIQLLLQLDFKAIFHGLLLKRWHRVVS